MLRKISKIDIWCLKNQITNLCFILYMRPCFTQHQYLLKSNYSEHTLNYISYRFVTLQIGSNNKSFILLQKMISPSRSLSCGTIKIFLTQVVVNGAISERTMMSLMSKNTPLKITFSPCSLIWFTHFLLNLFVS